LDWEDDVFACNSASRNINGKLDSDLTSESSLLRIGSGSVSKEVGLVLGWDVSSTDRAVSEVLDDFLAI